MHKKKFLSRTSFASLFLLLGTVLSACSKVESTKSVHPVKSFKSDLKSLLKETIKQDIDLSKTIKTSEGKQQIITSLKKSYGVNPKDTTKLLLDAWKQSFEEGEIGIADLDFEVAYPKTQDPFTMERKVDHFQMTYQSFKDLSIKAKLSYTFNWFGDYSSGGFTAKKGDKHYFDLFLKIKPDPNKSFKAANFKTEEKNSTVIDGQETTRNLEWIEFGASISWSLKGKDDASEKSVKQFLDSYANNTSGYSSDINLFSYLEYLIR
ncbi:lipoprotein [Mycoplasmoides pneumoniae]|uniref:Lipoprotein n=6 Tax=Mycoplasmoides pneumoniae TaxID=2104 RepID=A0AB38WB59_MYCPM|nr:MPN647 family lipoprotein [Mycoplasmoides pneumoniae]ADK86919.1 conserved hypothetical protein [Mycoplasmoides pneumoniae FH]ALA31429.1 hypothetical protein F536_00845 [Mycoplasmoides pneumoniae 39443]ALA35663.1 hypothetical protein F539_00850 [Mycoplasmoides pneumoniae FH]ALA36369.1 hypothetical protein F538_00855 [Mycoplasmoides pneumoniae M1139]ALA37780.1 hypothetical protein G667_00840 [Mycoplasmoides pneumoniae M2592]